MCHGVDETMCPLLHPCRLCVNLKTECSRTVHLVFITVVPSARSASARPACFPLTVFQRGQLGVADHHCPPSSASSRRQSRDIARGPRGPLLQPGHTLPSTLPLGKHSEKQSLLPQNSFMGSGSVFSYTSFCVKLISASGRTRGVSILVPRLECRQQSRCLEGTRPRRTYQSESR